MFPMLPMLLSWLTLASAVLYVLAFPPYGLSVLSFVALVPWLVLLMQGGADARRRRVQPWMLGSLITILGFHWVAYVLKQFAGLPMPVAGLGLILFSLIGQPQFLVFGAIFGLLLRPLKSSRGLQTVGLLAVAALTYTALDYLFPKLFRDTLGHSWAGFEALRLNARWAGGYGLTFLTVFFNLALAWLITSLRERGEPSAWPAIKRGAGPIAASSLLLILAGLYGSQTQSWISETLKKPQARIPLAVIQANIGDIEKIAAESGVRTARKKVLKTFFELSDQALARTPRPQAVIWPETSYPTTFRTPDFADDLELDAQMETFSRSRKVGLFFGGYDQERGVRRDYNAFFFLAPEARDLKVYHKNRLLLFGEEMPFSTTFPVLRRWFPQVGNFGRGAGPTAVELPTEPVTRAAPAICYEVLFADDMIAAKRQGAQWILNITNDSWFGPHAEPELHLSLSTFRSIETGLPMVRSTNTGISAWVDPLGQIHQPTPTFEPAVLSLELPVVELPPSPVERFGDWFPRFALLITLCFWAYFWAYGLWRLPKV